MQLINQKTLLKRIIRWGTIAVTAICILAFFSFNISESGFSVFFNEIRGNYLLYNILFVGICWFLNKAEELNFKAGYSILQSVSQCILAAFFSGFSLISVCFETDSLPSFSILFSNKISLMCFSLAFLGGVLLYTVIIRLIWNLEGRFGICTANKKGTLERFFDKHLYRNCILVMTICWLPQYLLRFPGAVPYDAWQSLAMYLGYTEVTTQHPLIWGAFFGFLTELGMSIGINWFGIFIICILNHVLAMLAVCYAVSTIKKLGFSNWFSLGVLAFFVILPPMSLYASTVYNDLIFSLSIMLLTIELIYYLYDRKTYFSRYRHWILTAVAVFGTITRYNGLYTMLAVIVVVAIREICLIIKKKGSLKQAAVIILVSMMVPLFCGQAVQATLNTAFDAREITSRAMFAMPIQQSVRCLIKHGDDIPKEDYDALHTVLTWSDEKYAEEYIPYNFDGVKESFKTDATTAELTAFIKAWIKLVIRYPQTCFLATAEQTYYLFSPQVYNIRYYDSISAHADLAYTRYGFDTSPFITENPVQETILSSFMRFQKVIFPRIPVLGLTVNMAAYTILLFAICLCLLFRKDKRPLILSVALLVTLAITFLGPAVFNHPRYIYPIMFSMPLLIAAFMMPKSKDNDSEANL